MGEDHAQLPGVEDIRCVLVPGFVRYVESADVMFCNCLLRSRVRVYTRTEMQLHQKQRVRSRRDILQWLCDRGLITNYVFSADI